MKKIIISFMALITVSAFASDCSISISNIAPAFNTVEIEAILSEKGYQKVEDDKGRFNIVTEVEYSPLRSVISQAYTATATLTETTDFGAVQIDQKKAVSHAIRMSSNNGGPIWRANARSKQKAVKKIVLAMDNCR